MTQNLEVLLKENRVEFRKQEETDRTVYFCDWKLPVQDVPCGKWWLLSKVAGNGCWFSHVNWSATEHRLYFRVTVRASKGRKALNG